MLPTPPRFQVPRRKVLLVAGTHAGNPPWIEDPTHPFQMMLTREGLETARSPITGLPYRWHTKVAGVPGHPATIWEEEAEDLIGFALETDCWDWIMHSHGGQVGIFAARALARTEFNNVTRRDGRPAEIRTFTTIATPVRADVPAREAVPAIRYWQHLCDADRDWIATLKRTPGLRGLGQLFDRHFSTRRTFDIPGVVNKQLKGISHSKLVNLEGIDRWTRDGLARAIREGGDAPAGGWETW